MTSVERESHSGIVATVQQELGLGGGGTAGARFGAAAAGLDAGACGGGGSRGAGTGVFPFAGHVAAHVVQFLQLFAEVADLGAKSAVVRGREMRRNVRKTHRNLQRAVTNKKKRIPNFESMDAICEVFKTQKTLSFPPALVQIRIGVPAGRTRVVSR